MVTICEEYEGSVSTSWYPVMLVLKHHLAYLFARSAERFAFKNRPIFQRDKTFHYLPLIFLDGHKKKSTDNAPVDFFVVKFHSFSIDNKQLFMVCAPICAPRPVGIPGRA